MKTWQLIALILGCMVLGGLAHEQDIQRQCEKKGRSGHSTIFGELRCSPIDFVNSNK